MQPNKNIKIFLKYFLGPLLFLWLAFSISQQIIHQPRLAESWESIKLSFVSRRVFFLILAVLLIFVNWGLEAWKWQLLVNHIHPIKFFQSFKAVLSGVSFSVTMPNRVGEYVGRMMYMPEGNRLRTISATIVGSLAQLIITMVAGSFGLLVLKKTIIEHYPQFTIWYHFAAYGVVFLLIVLVVVYFNVSSEVSQIRKWFKNSKYLYLIEALANFDNKFLLRLLFISLLRYTVFLLQYIFIFNFFEVNVSVAATCWAMSVVFLALAIVPSIALVEVGLRGEISLKLLGIFSSNSLGIGVSTVTIWFLNLIVPAIVGSLFLLSFKLINKDDGTV